MTQSRLVGVAGLVAWWMVGLPAVLYHTSYPPSPRWIVLFLLFGALFAADLRRPRLFLLAAQAVTALGLAVLGCNGHEGTLLALVAMQLGGRVGRGAGIAWIAGQTALFGAAVAATLNLRAAWLLAPPYLGFQLVTFFTFRIMAGEVAARAALAAANAELRAVQEILADRSRLAERLRIAHELHDALGHRLTAQTLQLEAALQRTSGAGRAHVEKAQALARELLADVRGIVADTQAREGAAVAPALRALADAVPRPQVHLEVAETLRIADPEHTHILLRCAQEIVTNAARHSAAEHLWIVVDRDGSCVRIRAHDDGRGSDGTGYGFGLRGMRDRLQAAGGELRIATAPGQGFDVLAHLPLAPGAA
jgi:signal transduction histidine kinase